MCNVIGRAARRAALAGLLMGLLAIEAVAASTPEAVLAASDGRANDRFGYSLAASGDTLVVGAPGAKAAYVFHRSAGVWAEEAKLTGPNSIDFGYSVAIDGDTIVVGDPGFTGYRGGVFVYRRTGVTWALEDWLISPLFEAWDVFGDAVAVSGDTAMVGAPLQGTYDQGAVFMFARSGTTWASVAGPANWTGYALGSSIALSGTRALCTSVGWNRVDVVDRQGIAWTVTSTLVAGGGGHDTQDMGVAFDGDTAVVGGTNETFVFREVGAIWTEEARVPAASPVAIDGDTILLGGDDSALVYTRRGTTWYRHAELSTTGAGGTQRADGSVAVDGNVALVGAPRRDSSTGAVLVFDLRLLDLPVTSPDGEFLAVLDANAVTTGRGLWDLTGPYSTTVKGNPLSLNLLHDPTGRLSGTAIYIVAPGTPVTMPIKGTVKGTRGSITMKGALKGADSGGTVIVSLTLDLTVDTANRQLVGRLTGSAKANGTTTPIDQALTVAIPGDMDGTWQLQFDLDQAGRTVTGTALLKLSNEVEHAFVVRGKAGADGTAVLSLTGDPSDPTSGAIRIKATITPLSGAWARLESFSARGGYGQMLGW